MSDLLFSFSVAEIMQKRLHSLGAVCAVTVYIALSAFLATFLAFSALDCPAWCDIICDCAALVFLLAIAWFQLPAWEKSQESPDALHVQADIIDHVLDHRYATNI